jgi:hypothetical protein
MPFISSGGPISPLDSPLAPVRDYNPPAPPLVFGRLLEVSIARP